MMSGRITRTAISLNGAIVINDISIESPDFSLLYGII